MNKLTVNRVALGSLRRRRGQYRAILLGAFLAIFFVSSLFLAVQSLAETDRQAYIRKAGNQNAILRDAERIAPETLLESGLVTEAGNVFVIAETEQIGCAIGYYDEKGAEMAGRTLIEGRMPEAAGEIAVENHFLQALRLDAALNDSIELTLKIPTKTPQGQSDFLSGSISKTYRIVGILSSQSIYLQGSRLYDGPYTNFPSAIVSDKERVEAGGRAVVHRLLRFAPGVGFDRFERYAREELDIQTALNTTPGILTDRTTGNDISIMLAGVGVMGAVLVLAACLGVVNAFSANLSERRMQIGMMRAIGATSRQIRRIFGREALLLALLIAPLAIGLSFLFVWGVTRLSGALIFHADLWFLPVDLVASLLCISLAAWIPLTGASRVSPMQAIREVSLLRAKKRIRLRPRETYRMPVLIARRHLSLYRTRQAGIAIIVALSVLMIGVGVPMAAGLSIMPTVYAYEINGMRWSDHDLIETNVNIHQGLTDADRAEVLSLPLVSGVDVGTSLRVNLLLDAVTPYAWHPVWTQSPEAEYGDAAIVHYQKIKTSQNVEDELYPVWMHALDAEIIEELRPHLLEGHLDIDALNAGREVLLYAPEVYYEEIGTEADGSFYLDTTYEAAKNRPDAVAYYNDQFRAGDPVNMLRLFIRGDMRYEEDEYGNIGGVLREDAQTRIGAIIGRDARAVLSNYGMLYTDIGTVFTTNAGLIAFGFETAGYQLMGVRLSESPDQTMHEYLSDQLDGIAARGEMEVYDNIQFDQDNRSGAMLLNVCLIALSLLMLSMCVSLVNNAITNRVRSDKRTIGTLRAVGASLGDIILSYRLQAFAMIAWGLLIGLALCCIFHLWQYFTYYWPYDAVYATPLGAGALAIAAFSLALAGLCRLNLSSKIRGIARDSIVSNIREL